MSDRSKLKNNQSTDNEINPHMPQYIIKPPWYLNQTEHSLNHQKAQVEVTKIPITTYTMKGVMKSDVYKFRKGACDNCGAVSHKTKECLERPRQRGAKFSNKDFSKDEFIYEVPLDYEGKRDRWNGYDPNSFSRIMNEYQRFEDEKRKKKEEAKRDLNDGKVKKTRDEDSGDSGSSDDENLLIGDKESDIPEQFKQVVEILNDKENLTENNASENIHNVYNKEVSDEDVLLYLGKMKNDSSKKSIADIPKDILYQICTSKSLHVGGDYSKYLFNLALNSAYYDAKSRSMREDPNPGSLDLHSFKGDNYIRNTGDTVKLVQLESFIREANEKNKDLNLNNVAMPSQAELFHKYVNDTKGNFRSNVLKKIISKYGGEEHLKVPDNILPDKDNDQQQFDDNVNDDNFNINKARVKSVYTEDVYLNNHCSVWGSFYNDNFGWGFKCCLSFDKNSWCKGEEGYTQNLKLIEDYKERLSEGLRKQKEKLIEKDEQLRKRNSMEEKEGVFSEMFDRMEKYEQTGKVEFTKRKTYRDEKE